jgi:site-specific DNA recombinase
MRSALQEMSRCCLQAGVESPAKQWLIELSTIERDAFGQPRRVGSQLELHPEQSAVALEMFERYANGETPRVIAADFNAREIPSPGSSWRRQVRRCRGWMGSAIYTILVNDLYTGHVKWNQHRYERDPDTKIHKRRSRPKSEWLSYHDESLRIVSDELWMRCVQRREPNPTAKLKCGGRPKFLLSGIMKCGLCGASYVIKNQRDYGCAGYVEGRDCPNHIAIRRDKVEAALLNPVYDDVLAPKRIERMAKELQIAFTKGQTAKEKKAAQVPTEIQAIEDRIQRLRARLRSGDPDLTSDELEGALAKAEEKRRSLLSAPSVAGVSRAIAMLPSAAEDLRRQIKLGLAGNVNASLRARVALRQYFGGQIKMLPEQDGSLYAEYLQQRISLLQGVGTNGGPCRDRTYDQLIKSQLLYQLS